MAIGLKVDNIVTELGSSSFLHAFFSTVSYHLETKGWGSRFPILLNELYQGKLEKKDAHQALCELSDIKTELLRFSPKEVVWDIDDLSKRPPWGDNIAPAITNLSNYFVTSTARDLISTLEECVSYFETAGNSCEIVDI